MELIKMIVAGFGFRKGVSTDSLADALSQACVTFSPNAFATLQDKEDVLRGFAELWLLPLIVISSNLAQAQLTLPHSSISLTKKSTGSVAEATALAAAGANARLTAPRSISTDRMATCAIAIGDN
jgi:cobalt-precorrin 5A hydrolase